MIVGQKILDRELITGGNADNLKNGTFDLTVGEILPIGKEAVKAREKSPAIKTYYLEPREMVWVLSKEEFNMPKDVTGLATLRTAYTRQGILALNVGIIDPFFHGPISTALINFSDKPRRIEVGEKFFRVAFFKHDDVTPFRSRDQSIKREDYLRDLENASYSEFSRSFLNIPTFDDEYYHKKFGSIVYYGITKNKWVSIPLLLILIIAGWFLVSLGFWEFLTEKWDWIGELWKKIKVW